MTRYYTLTDAADHVQTTRTTLARFAKKDNVGLWVQNRLVGLTLKQAERLRAKIQDRAGRPKVDAGN